MAMDISIKQLSSILKTEKDIKEFLNSKVKIEEKIDGVKVQIYLKKDAKGKGLDNWIVSYKGNIIYYEEVDINRKNTVGVSEFAPIFEKLKNIDTDLLPKGYQYFFEYTLNKMVKTKDLKPYKKVHELILLSYGPSNCKEILGKLVCDNNKFSFDNKRPLYAKIFGAHIPPVVFDGILYPYKNLIKGLKSKDILNTIEKYKYDLENADYKEYLNIVIDAFLESESVFGGLPEGYVVWYNGKPYKFQQDTQFDKNIRKEISKRFKGPKEEEIEYWARIKVLVDELIEKINDISDIRKALKKVAKIIDELELPNHSKKDIDNIKDDLMTSVKLEIIRKLTPDTGLIIGKMRIFTKAHYQLIKKALNKNKFLIIALSIAKGKDKTFDLRKKFILDCFEKDKDRIEILGTQNGFIPSILKKAIFGMGVNNVYAGSDRIEGYTKQLQGISKQINVIELKRNNDISATNVLNNIDNEEYFKENTPPCMWNKYELIKENIKLFK